MKLAKFDKKFYNNLEDKEKILINKGIFYTINLGNKKVGIVGFIPSKFSDKQGFIQIIIKQEFRGKGLLEQAEDLLAKKHELEYLFATIKKDNIASIKSHKKAGFKKINIFKRLFLIKKGLLQTNEVRLYKKY